MKNALCLGTFDGVHIGHRAVFALAESMYKIAVTFKKPPKAIISGKDELIYTFEEKCRILKEIGINEIVSLDFEKVRNISPEEFLEEIYEKYNPSVIACGFNYKFGKNGAGNTDLLFEFCKKKGIEFKCAQPATHGGLTVSSTIIRNNLKNGEIEKANKLLYEPFSFTAPVNHGEKRGRTIGFPTINQVYPKELTMIKNGVYKVKVIVDDKEYSGISDIGKRPTYPLDYTISETYIKDFSGDLYDKEVKIIPLQFLREEKKFNNLSELKKQIAEDLDRI